MSLRVAVAQIESIPGDIEANHRKHLDVIDAARSAGADVLVFPELSLTGHGSGAQALELAMGREHRVIHDIARASQAMCTVFGFIEEAAGAQFYNAAVAVQDSRIVFLHRKINLATYGRLDDGKHFAAGNRLDTFVVAPQWRAALMVCADTWNPALVHLAALQGATLLLAPVSSALEAVDAAFDNPGGWDVNLRFHALTYGLPVAMANRVGREGELTFWGCSRILDAFGASLAQARGAGEELVNAELDFDDVRRARHRLPTVRDANTALVQRELERVLHAPTEAGC
ncbi:MAG: nitrilase [Pseudomonadota bacterium]|nr:nitrilase [Pseudomonadota bacterium]